MKSDVYICYAPEDEKAAEDICSFLEQNGKTCWIKKRDFGENDTVKKLTEAVESSQCFVLVYSKDSNKSNYVSTDVDIAFSAIPIIVFAVDDSEFERELGFYLKDVPKIDAYPNPENFHDELLKDISKFTAADTKMDSQNDVYISYSDEDLVAAQAICHVLEENKIKCWIKKRDLDIGEGKDKIIEAIEKSKAFVLVYSKNAKNSNFVNADVDFALSDNVPILSYKIEECENSQNLNGVHWLDAFPNPENNFKQLVIDVGNLINKPVETPKITKHVDLKKEIEAQPKEEPETSKKEPSKGLMKDKNKRFKLILVAIAVIGIIAIAGAYLLSNPSLFLDEGQQIVKKGDGSVSIEDEPIANKLTLIPMETTLKSKNCLVKCKIYDKPENFNQYTVNTKYYDESGNKIDETTTSMNDIVIDENGMVVLVNHTCSKEVYKIENTVFDENGNQVFSLKMPSA